MDKRDEISRSMKRGQRIATAMLCSLELSSDLAEQCVFEEEYRRKGTVQDNAILRYLAEIIAGGDRETLAGFCSVLSDYVSTCCQGFVPDIGYYEKQLRLRVPRVRLDYRGRVKEAANG